jgi:hypothetical protein
MNDPLSAQQLLSAGVSGALMVFFGALYALFLCLHRLQPTRYWSWPAYASFLILVACSIVLAVALELTLFWQAAMVFILICYYFSPPFIWRLSVATHADTHTPLPQTREDQQP